MLKITVPSLADVAEAFKGEYEADGSGAFRLKLEGDHPAVVELKKEVANFRDTNIGLKKKNEEQAVELKKFEGFDPAKAGELAKELEALKANPPKGSDDKKLQQHLEAAVAPLTAKIAALETAAKAGEAAKAKAEEDLRNETLKNAIKDAGINIGVDEKALPDFVRRGLEVFKVEDGQVVAKKGESPLFSEVNPAKPLSVAEWAGNLQTEAPHLFKPSRGGGANPRPGGDGPSKVVNMEDTGAIGASLADIASGKARVQPNT